MSYDASSIHNRSSSPLTQAARQIDAGQPAPVQPPDAVQVPQPIATDVASQPVIVGGKRQIELKEPPNANRVPTSLRSAEPNTSNVPPVRSSAVTSKPATEKPGQATTFKDTAESQKTDLQGLDVEAWDLPVALGLWVHLHKEVKAGALGHRAAAGTGPFCGHQHAASACQP